MHQDIEVPETILKKRKQNEKAREERQAKAAETRKVCICRVYNVALFLFVMYIYPFDG